MFASLTGCESPDPDGRMDEFHDATDELRGQVEVEECTGEQVAFAGSYFLGVKTVLNSAVPIMFDVTVTGDESEFDISFQTLRTDEDIDGNARDNARTPVGDPLVATGVTLESDGTFTFDFTNIVVPGEGNPISGGDISATLTITATVCGNDSFCGTANVEAFAPTAGTFNGTFGGILTDDFTGTAPANCDEVL